MDVLTLFPLLVIVGIVLLIVRALRSSYRWKPTALTSPKLLCVRCKSVGAPATKTNGSSGVEVALWFFFLVPGLIYSIWRRTTRSAVCPVCHSGELVPLGSPAAQQILGVSR